MRGGNMTIRITSLCTIWTFSKLKLMDAVDNKSVCDLTVDVDEMIDLRAGTVWKCGLTGTFLQNFIIRRNGGNVVT